ncbi:hypothetical protein CAL7716_085480 [Calothrix sp. PCC 7716]|nr:hypothetical protein CAL7716_085480 [Calothrix sp. PCC 7716]
MLYRVVNGGVNMKLQELKEAIFSSGNVVSNPDQELDFVHEVQAEGEFVLSEKLTQGEISYSESQSLMTKLIADYGYKYPVKIS